MEDLKIPISEHLKRFPYCSPVDMIADKTDNVEVVVALDGTPIDDEDDIGNE